MLINEKIEHIQNLIKRKVTYEEIAPILGLNSGSALRNWAYRKRQLKDFEIDKIDKAFNINTTESKQNATDAVISVDYYPDMLASCGNGTFEMSQEFTKYQLPAYLLPPSTYGAKFSMCHAKGNSMYPRIWDGDFVILEHYDGMQIVNGEMYIFCYEEQIYLKRLTKNINQIVVESENPEFPTQYIEREEMNRVYLIGHVICWGKMMGNYLTKRF